MVPGAWERRPRVCGRRIGRGPRALRPLPGWDTGRRLRLPAPRARPRPRPRRSERDPAVAVRAEVGERPCDGAGTAAAVGAGVRDGAGCGELAAAGAGGCCPEAGLVSSLTSSGPSGTGARAGAGAAVAASPPPGSASASGERASVFPLMPPRREGSSDAGCRGSSCQWGSAGPAGSCAPAVGGEASTAGPTVLSGAAGCEGPDPACGDGTSPDRDGAARRGDRSTRGRRRLWGERAAAARAASRGGRGPPRCGLGPAPPALGPPQMSAERRFSPLWGLAVGAGAGEGESSAANRSRSRPMT